jgi:hypothetical protein
MVFKSFHAIAVCSPPLDAQSLAAIAWKAMFLYVSGGEHP